MRPPTSWRATASPYVSSSPSAPPPELSFAVREYGCIAGVNVTASHNPKEYNGYKVYWSDGAQLPPQHAAAIAKELEHIDIFTGVTSMDFDEAVNKGLITMLGEDCDKRFMANVMSMVNDYETVKKVADDFKLVYTPFHGCGHKLVPEALTRLGIKHLLCVPEQMVIDGNFPTVVSPNPENPEGFYLAIDLAKKNDVDFILGTDPTATASVSWCATNRASSSLSPATRRACCCSTI